MNSYELAHAKVTEATKVFNAAKIAYRSLEIGDKEFLAARAIYNTTEAEYDAAYAVAQSDPEVIDTSCYTEWTPETARHQNGGTYGS